MIVAVSNLSVHINIVALNVQFFTDFFGAVFIVPSFSERKSVRRNKSFIYVLKPGSKYFQSYYCLCKKRYCQLTAAIV